jgi:hypothetical protein
LAEFALSFTQTIICRAMFTDLLVIWKRPFIFGRMGPSHYQAREDAVRPANAKRADVKKILKFDELAGLWEDTHGKA